jgi:Oxidoreductase molybdopterin binding domain
MTRPHIPRVRPAVTADEIWPELILISRRFMLTRGLSLGGLALLTGCDLSTHSGVDAALWKMMRFNDRVLAALFSRTRLAPTYPVRAVTNPFRFNAYYQDWQLVWSGLVTDKTPWTVDKMRALPLEAQVTRHICIEGWSQIGQWSGVPLHVFLQRAGADLKARYVSFECFDGYSTSIDMPSALHPQTILALDFLGKRSLPNGVLRCGCGYPPSLVSRVRRISRQFPSRIPIRARLLGRPGLQLVFGIVVHVCSIQSLVHRTSAAKFKLLRVDHSEIE